VRGVASYPDATAGKHAIVAMTRPPLATRARGSRAAGTAGTSPYPAGAEAGGIAGFIVGHPVLVGEIERLIKLDARVAHP
jgi:hypothetical protein